MLFVAIMTAINVPIFAIATYSGTVFMESTQFCGQTCHSVMDPEYTAYQRSPHARVACVECHIGPGAPWFVRSKLSGSYQVLAVTFNLYPRPIPDAHSQFAPGARNLRAVPLARALFRRQAGDQDEVCRRRKEFLHQRRPAGPHRRAQSGPQAGGDSRPPSGLGDLPRRQTPSGRRFPG